jgi:hypothetical protein
MRCRFVVQGAMRRPLVAQLARGAAVARADLMLLRQAISQRLRFHPVLIATAVSLTVALAGGLVVGPRLMSHAHSAHHVRYASHHHVHHRFAASCFSPSVGVR